MLITSVILFAIAALGGIVLARWDDEKKQRPMSVSLIHGAVAAAGLVVLLLAVFQGGVGTLPVVALIIFVVAALGGFVLFSYHLRGSKLPRGLIMIHGLAAVVAEVLLIVAII